uniref:F-box domain-containing protein n=1 Tax=Globodera pallida TaxID=36090 RepID=A0A183CI55_GLOPA
MSNAMALNTSDESQIRRRRLPLELQCELFSALPLEHASRLLLLSNRINNNCISHVRKLHGKWKHVRRRLVLITSVITCASLLLFTLITSLIFIRRPFDDATSSTDLNDVGGND